MKLLIPAGTSDIFGASMKKRKHVIEILEKIYQSYGFEPLSTPTIEYAEVFKGHHGEGEKIFFKLQDKYVNNLILRYDLTVPLARFVGMHPEIILPYKRYQFASSFRDDDVDHGHFREFTQCDGDIIGDGNLSVDAEIIAIAYAGLKNLRFPDFIIRLNHRQLIKGIAEYACGPGCDILLVQRALDFADKTLKIGLNGIKQDLLQRGLAAESVDKLVSLLELEGENQAVITKLIALLKDFPAAIQGLNELKNIISYLDEAVKKSIKIDLTLARGADYYSGFILEGVISGSKVGAVLGGGRYDNLVAALGGSSTPATGMAFGLDRIITALDDLNINNGVPADVILVATDRKNDHSIFTLAQKIRSNGFNIDLNMSCDSLEAAIIYANSRGYPMIVYSFQIDKVSSKILINNDITACFKNSRII